MNLLGSEFIFGLEHIYYTELIALDFMTKKIPCSKDYKISLFFADYNIQNSQNLSSSDTFRNINKIQNPLSV